MAPRPEVYRHLRCYKTDEWEEYGCIDESGPVHIGFIFKTRHFIGVAPGDTYDIQYYPDTYTLVVKDRYQDLFFHAHPDTGIYIDGPGTQCV